LAKTLFALADGFLDRPGGGPLHLNGPAAAKIVEDAILFGSSERYELLAWCVMANHVHVLVKPIWELARITRGIKGYSARAINDLHGARGRTFWQDESYDHWARDEAEIHRIIDYIENNPVAAGLCTRPEQWPWSSARFRDGWPRGTAYRAQPVQV
jgi:putative transposase